MLMRLFFFISFFALSTSANSRTLVPKESIERAKKQTATYRLRNDIPVIYRHLPNSQLFNAGVVFYQGSRDLELSMPASLDGLTMTVMSKGTDTHPKSELDAMIERLSLEIGCSAAEEFSYCQLGSIREDWQQALKILSSVILEPSFAESEINIAKDQYLAAMRSTLSDPASIASESSEMLFFPVGHPLRRPLLQNLESLPTISRTALVDWHRKLLNANNMAIVVVGDIPKKDLLSAMNAEFGDVKGAEQRRVELDIPKFDKTQSASIIDKPTPTAYVSIKFNAPAADSADASTFGLLVNIVSDLMFDEVRSKRSLSYSVRAAYQRSSVSVGSITASTSKPDDILPAIASVIRKVQTEELSRLDLEERKTVFATHYYASQESNRNFVQTLASNYYWQRDPHYFYEFPERLDKISPTDLMKAAVKWFRDFRVAIVYDPKKVSAKVVESFVNDFSATKKKPKKK
jgi:zinc protease